MAKADPIKEEAYKAWELKEFSEAAELFLNAAQIESKEAHSRSKWSAPDSSILHRLRAGFCLFDDGQADRALELLKEGLDFNWRAARLWGDRYDAERCHICHILHFANQGDDAMYASHVERAVRDGRKLGLPFPWSQPAKKDALTAALAMEDFKNLSEWIAVVDADSRQNDPQLGLLCMQAERALAKL